MAEPLRLVIAVLAAGESRRFGDADKLAASFMGFPLGHHAVDKLSRIRAAHRLVIAAHADHLCAEHWGHAGFAVVANPNALEGMGTSVAVAARIAQRAQADALMIALADMPMVPAAHYRALVRAAQAGESEAVIASTAGDATMPPAVFGRDHFEALTRLSGDQGARELLQRAQTIECPAEWLVDIDTPEALAKWQ